MLKKMYTCSGGIELLNIGSHFSCFPATEDDDVETLGDEFYLILVDEDDLNAEDNSRYPSYCVAKGAKVDVLEIPRVEKYL